jgi:hypothetical protein
MTNKDLERIISPSQGGKPLPHVKKLITLYLPRSQLQLGITWTSLSHPFSIRESYFRHHAAITSESGQNSINNHQNLKDLQK